MTTTLIGRWGRLADVRAGAPFPVEHADTADVATALTGRTHGPPSVRPVSRRRWSWDISGLTDAEAAKVEQLLHDQTKGRLWWYEPTALGSNMVPADVAEPTPPDLGVSDAATTVTVDGHTFDCVSGEVDRDVPTVDGVGYTAKVQAGVHAGTLVSLTVESLDGDQAVSGTLGSDTQAAAGAAEELSVVWAASTEAGVRVTVDGAAWSGLQMFETAKDPGGWRPGRGIPQVVMLGAGQQLQWSTPSGDTLWRGASVTLVEVDDEVPTPALLTELGEPLLTEG